MFALLVFAAAVAASPLTVQDLDAAATIERRRKPDAFAKPTANSSLANRRFKIALPVMKAHSGSLSTEGVPAIWDYDAPSQTLRLSGWEQSWSDLELMLNDRFFKWGIEGFYARYQLIPGKNYIGENGFGARATIYRYVANTLGIAYPRKSFDDASGLPGPKSSLGHVYESAIPMSGLKARSIVAGLKLVVEGETTVFSDGSNIKCGSFEGGASMATRLDMDTRYCLVAGRFDRVSFQDAAGTVLAEWHP